jgi:hypothetical protein
MSPCLKYRNKPHLVTFKYNQNLYNNLHNGKCLLDESCFNDSGFESEVHLYNTPSPARSTPIHKPTNILRTLGTKLNLHLLFSIFKRYVLDF